MRFAAILALLALPSAGFAEELSQQYLAEFFAPIQEKSIADKREYCGYFGYNDAGELIATEPVMGEEDSCQSEPSDDMVEVIASYHTHGAFHYEADSETPSPADLEADVSEETDGYIATPGGRIWMNDHETEKAVLLCDRNCTVSDPNYDDAAFPAINGSYDLDGLYERGEADAD